MSKTFSTTMVIVVQTTTMVPMICGTLILKKIWNGLAPSSTAASIVSSGMPRRAADRITIAKPVWIQISTTIRKKLFQGMLVSQVCGSPPNQTQIAFSTPIWSWPAGRVS